MASSRTSTVPPPPDAEPTPALLPPTQERWLAMTPAERQEVQDALLSAQEDFDELHAQPESDDHYDAKESTRRTLRDFFNGGERGIYVGAERAVFYPAEPGFTPDLIAVVDVATHKRDCWMVSAEGRGLDVIIEFHYKGKWRKDYVDNVKRYARLAVGEYFVFDLNHQSLTAYRLAAKGGSYEQIRPQAGRVRSERLGLDLGVRRGQLRFYLRGAVLPTTEERIGELSDIADQEHARADVQQARAERSLSGLRDVFFALLAHQGVALNAEQGARIHGCIDPALLQRRCERALTSRDASEILQDG